LIIGRKNLAAKILTRKNLAAEILTRWNLAAKILSRQDFIPILVDQNLRNPDLMHHRVSKKQNCCDFCFDFAVFLF